VNMVLDDVATIQAVAAAVAAAAFVVLFALRSRWRSSAMGRHLMGFMAVTALVLTLTVVVRVTGQRPDAAVCQRVVPIPGWPWIRVAMWAAIDVILWWRLILLVRAQHQEQATAGRPGVIS
jgi:hypothetical protein